MNDKHLVIIVIFLYGFYYFFQKMAIDKQGMLYCLFVNYIVYILSFPVLYKILSNTVNTFSWSGISFSVLAEIVSMAAYITSIKLLASTTNTGSIVALAATYPAVTFLLSLMFMNESFSIKKMIGIALTIAGVVILER